MQFRAILFDLGDTLFRLHPLAGDLAGQLGAVLVDERVAEADEAVRACARGLDTIRKELLDSYVAGQLEEHDMAELASRHLGAAGVEVPRATAERLADVFGRADVARFEASGGVAARLERLREAGCVLGAVSNTTTSPELLEAYLAGIGLLPLFDTMVYSRALGIRKPHPETYESALRALGVGPGAALFVGDRVREDVIGPQAVGIRAVLTHEFRQEDPALSEPLGVIQRLDDLWVVPGVG